MDVGAETDNEQTELNGNEQSELNGSRAKNNDEQSDLNGSDTEFVFPDTLTNEDIEQEQEQEQDGHGEFIFSRSNEGIERVEQMSVDDYDDSEEDSDEADNSIIVISSDDEEEGRNNYNTYSIPGYRRMMGVIQERPVQINNLETFSSIFARSIISSTISAATATSTTTTTTITSSTLAATTTTARTPVQRCCICLSNILTSEEGINLHDNIHSIHIFCLMDFLANSQIIWLETSFRFDCPLCREPVYGAVMMIS